MPDEERRRETPNLETFLEAYDPETDLRGHSTEEILEVLQQLSDVRDHVNRVFVLQGERGGRTQFHRWAAQSQIFVVDCIPHVLETLRANHVRSESVTSWTWDRRPVLVRACSSGFWGRTCSAVRWR